MSDNKQDGEAKNIGDTNLNSTTTMTDQSNSKTQQKTEQKLEKKSSKMFKLDKRIGDGAEGKVYLATQISDNKVVALKSIICHTEEEKKTLHDEV